MSPLESSITVEPGRTDPARADSTATRLMLQIRRGDSEALECLMRRYWSNLVGYAYQFLGSMDEASDVAQEVFVRTWEHRYRWKSGGSATAFLYTIARNLSLLQLRRRRVRRRSEPELHDRAGGVRTPIEEAFSREFETALHEALAALPDRRREAFVLVRVDGLSLRAAAEQMGVTKRTVANHVNMARSDLSQVLQPFVH